jgi:hypothetical protein
MTMDDLREIDEPMTLLHETTAAIPPVVDPERWEDFDGFRETFLADFTVPEHNAALRRLCNVLAALIGEAYPVMPKAVEGWYRTRVRAALADLRFLQGFLAEMADASVAPSSEEALARLVRRKVLALGKIADGIERALAVGPDGAP